MSGTDTVSTPEGLLLVNKPVGPTSHDVVALVRRRLALQRVGHAGTLDPMAEGLLVVLVGRATKCQQTLQGHEKSYEATLRFGTQTDTGDAAGKPIRMGAVPSLDREMCEQLLKGFCGALTQTPPVYSAVKVQGRPAYWWARREVPVALSSRQIFISELSLLEFQHDAMSFRVRCSAGTYIRTLGESIAERLGSVGHVTRLVRLRVGSWRLEDALPMAWIAEASPKLLVQHLLAVEPARR